MGTIDGMEKPEEWQDCVFDGAVYKLIQVWKRESRRFIDNYEKMEAQLLAATVTT